MTSKQDNRRSLKIRLASGWLKWFFPALCLIICLIAGTILWSGYGLFTNKSCQNWRPGISQKDKIVAALEWSNSRPSLTFEMRRPETGEVFRNNERQIPYDDVETILRHQPSCCNLYESSSAKTSNPIKKIPDGDEGTVVLRYIAKYQDIRGEIGSAATTSYIDFNECKEEKNDN